MPSSIRCLRCSMKSHEKVLLALESCKGIQQFNQVHAQLMVSGLFQHPFPASRAIKKLCSDSSMFPRAISLFDYLHQPDAFLCNTIMRFYARKPDFSAALSFYYHKMLARWVDPNHYTFPLLIKVCAEIGSLPEGEKGHARVVKFGFESDVFTLNSLIHMYSVFGRIGNAQLLFDNSFRLDLVSYNSMIDGYVKNGETVAARQLFDEMPERDLFSWNCMIAGYVGIGDMEAATELFERMPARDVVSWNCMIDGCARIGNVSLALELFDQMPVTVRNEVSWNSMLALYVRVKNFDECLRLFDRMMERGEAMPNEATLVSVLTACANLGRLNMGMWVHSFIKSNNIKPDVLLSTCLLTMYAKCGAMDLARDVFDEMPVRSTVSWNSMIMGYGLHGNGDKALELFLEMEKTGPQPNDATFISVLSACTHAGMVMEGWWYFDLMHRVYKIEPKLEHYGCMVDLLARAGLMKNSEDLIRKVPVKAGSALWGALLSGCSTHIDSELGEIVAKRLIELEPQDIGPYILLSNIYAAQGRWDDVERVRLMIKEKKLQKEVASSLVHLEDFESKYFVKNNSVYRKRIMYSMLVELGTQMKLSIGDSVEEDNFRPR
ncbi:pentatricopeptide repeat-containing protein At3g29230-like [Gastrolobium bilobum]|uniref:pentatricopeptide repeat-containing protein At3g29230-like n=1 Tax=Gastrolobium bilobum TaxID=150636 RepID=UPI002AB02925|nr:pentatricopeptide repeat-containing protein At3g29230-like [Gastrolobium bilobum]XP_061359088.1 pentatricopeptide repeat-containing protein At3g29230-like [Gastrolobium bilobum]